jgi:hypothetical protein
MILTVLYKENVFWYDINTDLIHLDALLLLLAAAAKASGASFILEKFICKYFFIIARILLMYNQSSVNAKKPTVNKPSLVLRLISKLLYYNFLHNHHNIVTLC